MADGEGHLSRLIGAAMPGITRRAGGPLPRSLYAYVWRVSGSQQVKLCLLTVLVFPLSLGPVELQRVIVNNAVQQPNLSLLIWLGVAYFLILLVHAGLKFWQQNYQARIGEGVIRLLRKRIIDLAGSPADQTETGGSDRGDSDQSLLQGARASIVSAETERIGGFVGEALAVPLLNAGITVTMLVYMFVISPILGAVSLVLLFPAIYLAPIIQRRINALAARRTPELRALGDELGAEDDTGAETGGAHAQAHRYADHIFGLRGRIYMLKFLAKGLTNLVGHMGPLAIVTVGGWLVIEGRTEVGTIVAFISANERLLDPMRDLLSFYRQWQVARVQYRLYREAVVETG